jgi:pyruvate ferredoxin oxidoreductase gamma subunit
VLLGGFAAQTGAVAIDSVEKAIRERFTGAIAEHNVAAARAAFELIGEPAHA